MVARGFRMSFFSMCSAPERHVGRACGCRAMSRAVKDRCLGNPPAARVYLDTQNFLNPAAALIHVAPLPNATGLLHRPRLSETRQGEHGEKLGASENRADIAPRRAPSLHARHAAVTGRTRHNHRGVALQCLQAAGLHADPDVPMPMGKSARELAMISKRAHAIEAFTSAS
eukprot:CAMPEP_0181197802 /NCGR_PEP_ID=MMETSP1096-20121128/16245_1 /TAXON_ID=156174 ORGANISM="Chrysochromulina ericina, Strain CCMP281" /NCGR_SAMPLE_ID=MMETSP1096 /ASSEMBLY_ACC=CAM_ASM_000453 /LENGTH=170 /DNA_ID=CAMNT_0023287757 /DNA_START=64 /DNA_END=577 /DNA_ORIENTATION=-